MNSTGYKIVHLSYTEQASLVVKANNNEEAENAIWEEFPNIPDLRILSIEDAPEEVVAQVKQYKEEREAPEFVGDVDKRVLN